MVLSPFSCFCLRYWLKLLMLGIFLDWLLELPPCLESGFFSKSKVTCLGMLPIGLARTERGAVFLGGALMLEYPASCFFGLCAPSYRFANASIFYDFGEYVRVSPNRLLGKFCSNNTYCCTASGSAVTALRIDGASKSASTSA